MTKLLNKFLQKKKNILELPLMGSHIGATTKTIFSLKQKKQLYFFRKLGQFNFKVGKTLITMFYKSVIENIVSFCITCWGGNSSKGDRIKVDRIIKIFQKFTTHVLYVDELCHKKTLDKIISI